MKIRTDLTAFSLTGLCVIAIVVLAVLKQPIPDLLNAVTIFSLGTGAGASLPTLGRTSSPAAAAAEVVATPAAELPAQAVVAAPALVPGRDWTESIPKITPEFIAAREAGR